jgi:hypothetical protein
VKTPWYSFIYSPKQADGNGTEGYLHNASVHHHHRISGGGLAIQYNIALQRHQTQHSVTGVRDIAAENDE